VKSKFIIAILVLFMILSGQTVTAEDSFSDTQEAKLLTALGIMDDFKDSQGNLVTRAEFSIYVAKLAGIYTEEPYFSAFKDVTNETKGAGSIRNLSSAGYINGFEDGYFYPESPILYEQAVKILIDILGYTYKASANGGYPTGYMIAASGNGLTRGFKNAQGSYVTSYEAAKLICNAIDIDIITMSSYGADYSMVSEKGKTILTEMLSIGKIKGRVTANEDTSIYSADALSKGRIMIGSRIFRYQKDDSYDFLGRNVTAYYYDNDEPEPELIYMTVNSDLEKSIEINAQDILPTTTVDTIYYEENDKIRDINIKNITVIYNGKFAKSYTDDDFRIECGTIRLLDTDYNNKYDIAFVTSYETYVTEYVTSEYIGMKYGVQPLETDDYDEIIVYRDGEAADITDIEVWDVLSVIKMDKKLKIYASGNKITSGIEEISEDFIKAGGEELEISVYYERNINNFPQLNFNNDFVIHLDYFGRIATVSTEITKYGSEEYAYLIELKETNKLDLKYTLRLLVYNDFGYTSGSEVRYFKVADKAKINGVTLDNIRAFPEIYDAAENSIKRQLIKIKTNSEGDVTFIFTAKNKISMHIDDDSTKGLNPDYVENYNGYTADEFTLDAIVPSGTAYRAAGMCTFESLKYQNGSLTNVYVTSSVKEAADDEFKIYGSDYLKEGKSYPKAYMYDVTEFYKMRIVVLVNEDFAPISGVDSISNDSEPLCVESISQGVNPDGNSTWIVNGYYLGKKVKFRAYSNELMDNSGAWGSEYYGIKVNELVKGSVIQFRQNSRDEIIEMRVIFMPGNNMLYTEKNNENSISEGRNIAGFYTAYGIVKKRTDDGLVYNAQADMNGENRAWDRNQICVTATVVIYNRDENIMKLAKLSEIRDNDKVFLTRINANEAGLIVVFR